MEPVRPPRRLHFVDSGSLIWIFQLCFGRLDGCFLSSALPGSDDVATDDQFAGPAAGIGIVLDDIGIVLGPGSFGVFADTACVVFPSGIIMDVLTGDLPATFAVVARSLVVSVVERLD